MTKYHVSPDTGRPNICRAQDGKCPLGSERDHYKTKESARAGYEKQMNGQAKQALQGIQKKKDKTPPKFVKSDSLSSTKTWKVVDEDAGNTLVVEVRKNRKTGAMIEHGAPITVKSSDLREVKLRDRKTNAEKEALAKKEKIKAPVAKKAPVRREPVRAPVVEVVPEPVEDEVDDSFDEFEPDFNEPDLDLDGFDDEVADLLNDDPFNDDLNDDFGNESGQYDYYNSETVCDGCGEEKPDVRLRVDPYHEAYHRQTVEVPLCNVCFEDRQVL